MHVSIMHVCMHMFLKGLQSDLQKYTCTCYYLNTCACVCLPHLAVTELMDASPALHSKVAPHLWGRPEHKIINAASSGLEAIIGVLAGDAHCNHMAVWQALGGGLQVKVF